MFNSETLRLRDFRGTNIHTPIHLHRVDGNDVHTTLAGNVHGNVALAAGRRAENDDGGHFTLP